MNIRIPSTHFSCRSRIWPPVTTALCSSGCKCQVSQDSGLLIVQFEAIWSPPSWSAWRTALGKCDDFLFRPEKIYFIVFVFQHGFHRNHQVSIYLGHDYLEPSWSQKTPLKSNVYIFPSTKKIDQEWYICVAMWSPPSWSAWRTASGDFDVFFFRP